MKLKQYNDQIRKIAEVLDVQHENIDWKSIQNSWLNFYQSSIDDILVSEIEQTYRIMLTKIK